MLGTLVPQPLNKTWRKPSLSMVVSTACGWHVILQVLHLLNSTTTKMPRTPSELSMEGTFAVAVCEWSYPTVDPAGVAVEEAAVATVMAVGTVMEVVEVAVSVVEERIPTTSVTSAASGATSRATAARPAVVVEEDSVVAAAGETGPAPALPVVVALPRAPAPALPGGHPLLGVPFPGRTPALPGVPALRPTVAHGPVLKAQDF